MRPFKSLTIALIAAASIVGNVVVVRAVVSQATVTPTIACALASRWVGRCRDCEWGSEPFDNYAAARRACQWHSEETGHDTQVIEVEHRPH